MMFYTDNPPDDFERYSAEQERRLAELPVCEICGESIQDEYLFLINDEFVCAACLIRDFRKNTDDYIG